MGNCVINVSSQGIKKNKVLVSASWKQLVVLKENGWGVKNPFKRRFGTGSWHLDYINPPGWALKSIHSRTLDIIIYIFVFQTMEICIYYVLLSQGTSLFLMLQFNDV